MKRVFAGLLVIFALAATTALGAVTSADAPIGYVGGAFQIQPSTSSWTLISISTGLAYAGTELGSPTQGGILVNSPTGNTKGAGCVIGSTTTIPTVSTKTWVAETVVGKGWMPVPVSADEGLWCVSENTTPETIYAQFYRMKP
jgi:hypothetical protein